ncbi:uncharacterized protein LOC111862637 [Cryptotermes secundus]|uniref:uncharacterized protein LOC111862637 n=1 Tax=Cryptotermes secundus TaxID=105785 RepID=UPI000CD7CC11|nr:uncharacterized protein LOC111862637 [Cryptotermes secundus]
MVLSPVPLFVSAVLLVISGSNGSYASSQRPSCATVKCRAGFVCILQQVQCVTAPCYSQPVCIPVEEVPPLTCATFDCVPGYYCVLERVLCNKKPCPIRPICVEAPIE